MKDFDEARVKRIREREERWEREGRDRRFQIGGETFEHRNFVPSTVFMQIAEATADTSGNELARIVKDALAQLIVTDGDEHSDALQRLERIIPRVEYRDLQDVCFWIIEEVTQRPTPAPSSSEDGRVTTGESSTDSSSSVQAEPAASPS